MTFNLRILLKGHYSYIAPVETWYSLSVNLSRWAFVEYRSGQLFTPISHGLSFLFPVCLRNPITAPDHATQIGKTPRSPSLLCTIKQIYIFSFCFNFYLFRFISYSCSICLPATFFYWVHYRDISIWQNVINITHVP